MPTFKIDSHSGINLLEHDSSSDDGSESLTPTSISGQVHTFASENDLEGIENSQLLSVNQKVQRLPTNNPQFFIAFSFVYGGSRNAESIDRIEWVSEVVTTTDRLTAVPGYTARIWNASTNPELGQITDETPFSVTLDQNKQIFSVPIDFDRLPPTKSILELQIKNNSTNPLFPPSLFNPGVDVIVTSARITTTTTTADDSEE